MAAREVGRSDEPGSSVRSESDQFFRIAEINVQRAQAAITILRQITVLLPVSEENQELLQEIVALARALRRAILAWQRQYATDPLVGLAFAARKQLRRAEAHRTKSGKSIERLLHNTYVEAERVGFAGSIKDWERLLLITA